MSAPSSFTGGCLCGRVRYSCSAPPLFMVNCHCRDCQRASGGPYAPTVVVKAESLTVESGAPNSHTVVADSGHRATRQFCAECGAQLFAFSSARPGQIGIKAGSLDDPSWYAPMKDVWLASAQPWDREPCPDCGQERTR